MRQRRVVLVLGLCIIWMGLFFLFASQVNLKGGYARGYTQELIENDYNFEYKYGFPTPWYSRYYMVDEAWAAEQENIASSKTCRLFDFSCSQVATPPKHMLVWTDISVGVLLVQASLALLPVLALGFIFRKRILHNAYTRY